MRVCRVRSSLNYMSGLQPSSSTLNLHLGLRPRLVCHGPSALLRPRLVCHGPSALFRPRLVCHGPSALFECDELMTQDTSAVFPGEKRRIDLSFRSTPIGKCSRSRPPGAAAICLAAAVVVAAVAAPFEASRAAPGGVGSSCCPRRRHSGSLSQYIYASLPALYSITFVRAMVPSPHAFAGLYQFLRVTPSGPRSSCLQPSHSSDSLPRYISVS